MIEGNNGPPFGYTFICQFEGFDYWAIRVIRPILHDTVVSDAGLEKLSIVFFVSGADESLEDPGNHNPECTFNVLSSISKGSW